MNAEQQTIGGRTFSFGVIPPVEAVKVEVAVARAIGEPLFKAFTEKNSPDAQSAGIAAMSLIASRVDADALLDTMQTVFKYITCDGQRVEMNATFLGRNKELWQVFIAALRFNFADFFGDGLFASRPEQIKTSN